MSDFLVGLMAESLRDGDVVATGVASPQAILAIAVAKATHAPRLRYLACVGSLDPDLSVMHASSEDLKYLDGRNGNVAIPDLFDHARRGRVDSIFFGAAEVDAKGRTNMSAIGDLKKPKVKLPGVAGASTLRRWTKRPVLVVQKQSKRNLVPSVSVVSTEDKSRRITLLTDLAVFSLGMDGARLVSRHASIEEIKDRTGFDFVTTDVMTPAPRPETLEAIKKLCKQ